MTAPDRREQIRRVHADFIHEVVAACHDSDRRARIGTVLRQAREQGWTELVPVVERILAGDRDASLLRGLDEEDRTIAESVLAGLRDPSTLPDPATAADPAFAAPGLAAMIHAAARGDARALQMLGHMAGQMQQAGGEMARIGALLRRLVNGERDPRQLGRNLGGQAESLLLNILEELGRLDTH